MLARTDSLLEHRTQVPLVPRRVGLPAERLGCEDAQTHPAWAQAVSFR